MRHVQLTIATISLGPRPLPLRHGTLQVVERAGGIADGSLDWEIVVHTIEREPVAHASHPFELDVITGVDDDGRLVTDRYRGNALLVRAIEHSLVFRGDGELHGFDAHLLS